MTGLADADRAELDSGVPQGLGPRPQDLLHLLGAGVGGEVQILDIGQPAEQRVAHAAADEVQLVTGLSEHRAEIAQDVGMPVEGHRGAGQQFGISS